MDAEGDALCAFIFMLHDVRPASAVHGLHRLCRVFCPMQLTAKPNLRDLTFDV